MLTNRTTENFNLRSELKRLGPRIPFDKIEAGGVYHIPPILELKRKVILVTEHCGSYIKCYVEEDGKSMYSEWIYDYELQSKFIVPYRRKSQKLSISKKGNESDNTTDDGLPF